MGGVCRAGAGSGAAGAGLGRVTGVGGRASDGGVPAFGRVANFGGVLSEVRGDAGADGLGGEVGGVFRLPASGLTYGFGMTGLGSAGMLLAAVCGVAYRLGTGGVAVRADVARLKLVPKLVDGFTSAGPLAGTTGRMGRQAVSPGTSSRIYSTSSNTQVAKPQYSRPTVTCRWSHL
jgi:hypothetical protein